MRVSNEHGVPVIEGTANELVQLAAAVVQVANGPAGMEAVIRDKGRPSFALRLLPAAASPCEGSADAH